MLTWLVLGGSFSGVHAAAPEAGVVIEPVVAVDLANDRPGEDTLESWTWIRARVRQPGNPGWFVGIDAEHHLRDGVDLEGTWAVRVAESGWSGPVGPLHLRVGNLVERWGKLDLTSVVDVLNPMDLRAGPLMSMESTRVPTPMARLQAGGSKIRTELVLIPFAGSDRAELVGGDWSVLRPGMLEAFLAEAAGWEGGTSILLEEPLAALQTGLKQADPSTVRGLSEGLAQSGRPEALLYNGEAALRLEMEGRGVDGALMAGALRAHAPATALAPALQSMLQAEEWPALDEADAIVSALEEPLSARWPRTWFAGGEVSTTAGPIGVRAEGGWWSDAVLQTSWLGSVLSPKLAAGLGLDWAHGSTVFLSVEGRWQRHLSPPADLFLQRSEQIDLGAVLRVSALSDRLELIAAGMGVVAHGEYLLRPEIAWRVSDPLQLGVGAIVLGGAEAPPATLGQAMRYGGGPFAYFGDNDSVFFRLRWIQ